MTGPFKELIVELYKKTNIPMDSPISEEHFDTISKILAQEYSEYKILFLFFLKNFICYQIAEMDLRVYTALSDAGTYAITAELIFPKNQPLLCPEETELEPINIFYFSPSSSSSTKDEEEEEEEVCRPSIGHYILCRDLKSVVGTSRFCKICAGIVPLEGSRDAAWHPCPIRCTLCHGYCSKTRQSRNVALKFHCPDCDLYYRSQRCFNFHKQNKVCCRIRKRCPDCQKVISPRKNKHRHCGEIRCLTCREWYPEEESDSHRCFISNDIGESDVLQSGEHKTFLDFGKFTFYFYCKTDHTFYYRNIHSPKNWEADPKSWHYLKCLPQMSTHPLDTG